MMAQIKLAEYTFDNSVGDCLPTLRLSSIEMTTEDIVSGVVTRRTVYIDDTTLPYQLYFQNQTALLTVDYLHIGSNITNLASLFSGCTKLKTVNTTNWDLSSCTNISFMFQNCSSLTKLDLRNWVTSSATTMQGMFHSCTSLTEIKGIENFDVSKVTTFGAMFYCCSSLTKLDLRNWVTSSATTFQDMFASCHNLEIIRVDNFDTSKVTGTGLNAMFSYCKKVKTLNLNSFTHSGSLGNVLNLCYNCNSLEYISMSNFVWGNCTSMSGMFTNCTNLKMLDLTTLDSSTFYNKTYGIGGIIGWNNCPVYYNSNICSSSDFTDIPNRTNLIDVQGRLMAIYDFDNTVTGADVYPTLTGATVTKTIDTQGSESYITHRVIGVDVMPTEIKFGDNVISGLLNVDYLAVTNTTTSLKNLFYNCNRLSSIMGTEMWDLKNITSMERTFQNCYSLTTPLNFYSNTGALTSIYACFWDCSAPEINGIKDWDVSLVINFADIFGYVKATSLDISGWDMGEAIKSQAMFSNCTNLTNLKIGVQDWSKIGQCNSMFSTCTSLMELDLTGVTFGQSVTNTSDMFSGWTSDQIVYVHDTNWTLDESPATVVRLRDKIIARYTFDNSISNCLPTFNDTMPTTEHLVSDVVNGTITKRIISTNGDLPRKILFSHDYYSDGRSILTCDYLDTSNCNTLVFLFYACNRLTYVNTSSWDTSKVTDFSNSFSGASAITELDTANIDTSSATTLGRMFYNCSSLKSLDLSSWNVSKVTSFDYMFRGCSQLTSLDISAWNTGSGTTFIDMFNGLTMTELDVSHFDMSKATNITGMFGGTRISTMDLSSWNLLNVTNMSWLFSGSRIQNVNLSGVNIPNVTNAEQMFSSTPYLQSVDFTDAVWNINSTVSMGSAFNKSSIQSLVLPAMKPSNLSGTWSECTSLTTIDVSKLIMSDCNNLTSTFNQCNKLTEIIGINKWDTSEVTTLYGTFTNCTSITELDLSGWDTRKVTDTHNMLMNWTNNQTIYYEPPYWSIGTTTLNSNINWVVNITRNNGYWLDMTGITGATTITLANENNLPTEEILTDWGDGTQNSELTHTYSTAGEYIVVSNLQNAKSSGNLKDYITKMTVYYASTPANLCFNYNKITEVTLTNNWAEKTIEKYGQKVSMTQMFRNCPLLELPNLEPIKQFKPTYCVGVFYNCQKFTSIDLTGWDLSNCTSLEMMFNGCTNLTEIKGIENWNISKCTSVGSLFAACSSLTSLDLSSWDTSSCTNMSGIFNGCSSLTSLDVSSWNFEKCTAINQFIRQTTNLVDFNMSGVTFGATSVNFQNFAYQSGVQNVNMSNITTADRVYFESPFYGCGKLKTINFSNSHFKPSTMQNMFQGCSSLTSLDLSSCDTSQCTNMSNTFNGCSSLTSLDLSSWNTDNVTSTNLMFNNCSSIEKLDLSNFTTTKLTNIAYMLERCSSLKTLDISNFNLDKFSPTQMFYSTQNIENIGLLYVSSHTVNLISQQISKDNANLQLAPTTIYYYDADPSQLTPVEGVTFKKYQTPTTIQLPPHIQLHSLPDGTRDEVDIKTGILTRNVGVVDNSKWSNTNGYENCYVYQNLVSNKVSGDETRYVLSDFPTYPVNWTFPKDGIYVYGGYIFIALEKDKHPNGSTLDDFKNIWIPQNNLTILYKYDNYSTTEQLILNYNNSCDYGRILPTGMCDKYDVVNSMYTQTMTSILLDGANTWDAMEEMTNVVKFTATGTTVGVEELNMLGAGGLYCDNDLFPNINDDSDVPHCRVDEAGNKFYIYVDKEMLMSPDLIGWQIWLQENNFNLIYELAEHLTYVKPYKELDATQARWEGMDCMRDGAINYHTNSSDNITMYPTLEYVAPSINNFEVTMLEPNTDYTIYAEGINTNDIINLGGTDINFNNGTVYTSGDNQWLRIDNNDSFYNMVIIKGDTTGEAVSYFEGMTSVENPKVQCGESTVSYTNLKLRSLPNGVKDTINVVTGEYVQRIGEREYQDGDLTNENILTDGINTAYELAEPITTKLDAQALLICEDGTINLSSDTGLLPTTHYTVPSTNTFHLSSMKTGTRYTLKYPSASGSITIGDITYKISSDSMLFTTPLKINGDISAIIFSDANPENVVLLEGAYNKREVPFFTGVKSVKNPNITIIDQLSTESTTYNCETEIELRGLPNGVADKLDIIKGKLTTNVGIRPYQEGDENLPNIWTDGYETVYALSSPVVTNVNIDHPTVTTNSLINLSSDYLIPQLNYRAPSSNNFPLDLLQPNTTYTLYADTLVSGSYTLGGTKTGVYSQPHTITLGDVTDNLLIFNGDLGLSNVMLVKGNSLKTTLPPYFLGIRSVTDGHLLVEGMAGEMNELTIDEGIVLRDCNGIKDTIDLITCTLTKRTGEITLTGSEGWFAIPNESVNAPDDYVVFALTLQGVDSSNKYDLICDTITSKYLYNKPHDTESIYGLNNSIRMCVKKSRIGGDTVNALKSWLNQNPTTVVYSLKTPIEIPLENVWTTLPPTSYNNQTEISSTVSSNSLKPMISVTVATTTLEEIVTNLEAQNAQLEEENIATMLALTSVYETMAVASSSVDTTEPQVATYGLRRSVEPVGMSVSPMGMVYAKLVSKGFKSIDEVPYNLQTEVMYALRGME